MKHIATRGIDEVGRVVLPGELRKKYQISTDSSVDFFDDNGQVVLRAAIPICGLCSGTERLKTLPGERNVCADCCTAINELD